LHKTAYLSIKAVSPKAKVYLTGLTYFWDYENHQSQYLSRLLTLIVNDPQAKANDFYFDGLIYHLYYKPQMIYDILNEIQYMLDVYNVPNKTIWLNETNAAPTGDPIEPPHRRELPFEVTLSEQTAFMIQIQAMAFAAGLERVQLYKLVNSHEHPEDVRPFGLVRGDKSRRPAFEAYRAAIDYLADFQNVELFRQGDVTVVLFYRGPEVTTVLWNWATNSRQITIQARANQAKLVDELGHVEEMTPQNGGYTLTLPPAECSGGDCFIGGAPRLIVEQIDSNQPEFFTVQPTPTIQPTPMPTIIIKATSTKRRMFAFGFTMLVVGGVVLVIGWFRNGN
jgi:hypothetical protein